MVLHTMVLHTMVLHTSVRVAGVAALGVAGGWDNAGFPVAPEVLVVEVLSSPQPPEQQVGSLQSQHRKSSF